MEPVVLIIHLILALGLVLVVLVQRSEGGGLGIGGGQGGLGSFASVRGTANFLTKLTWYFAAGFIVTSLTLAIMSGAHSKPKTSLLEVGLEETAPLSAPADAAKEEGDKAVKPVEEGAPKPTPTVPVTE